MWPEVPAAFGRVYRLAAILANRTGRGAAGSAGAIGG